MLFTRTAALAACLSLASAQSIRGFNTGSTDLAGNSKTQAEFMAEFQNQKTIQGTNGVFRNTRLYTMIQAGTSNTPISAIPAAIASNTGLLLGLWASAGQDSFNLEIEALTAAIKQYGSQLAPLVRGISVGSEDLYRITPTGIANDAGVGADPATIVSYIGQVRKAIAGTAWANAPVGHVDTWTAWTNGTNSGVWEACDWVGLDEYPYYQSQDTNPIEAAGSLFYQAYDATKSSTGKPIWVTESGWPTTGPTVGQAVASAKNARSYWLQVYCTLPSDVPVYWFTQEDSNPGDKASFGITGSSLTSSPLYDLSCADAPKSSSAAASSTRASSTRSAAASSKSSAASSAASSSHTSSVSGSGAGAGNHASVTVVSSSATPTSSGSSPDPALESTTSFGPSAASATPTPSPSNPNGAPNVQICTLALLIVPALLALMA